MKYRQTLAEFKKIKELRGFMRSALVNPEVFSKLMNSAEEFHTLLALINEGEEHLVDDGTCDKLRKISLIYNEVTQNYVKHTFGIQDVGLHNMHEIYSPLRNGNFENMLVIRDKFIRQGLLVEEANRLAEDYSRKVQEFSKGPFKFYQLIESHLDESQEAIKLFHD